MPSKAKTGKKLVIVESPAKSKTIAKYLGEGFIVEASIGHIRDLPQPSELPAELKKTSVGKFAVDIENDFKPYYVVSPDKTEKGRRAEGRSSKMPTPSISQPMGTARARPSRGTCWKCSSPRFRCTG